MQLLNKSLSNSASCSVSIFKSDNSLLNWQFTTLSSIIAFVLGCVIWPRNNQIFKKQTT